MMNYVLKMMDCVGEWTGWRHRVSVRDHVPAAAAEPRKNTSNLYHNVISV